MQYRFKLQRVPGVRYQLKSLPDPLAFGPWESVKDASADSAQAAGFTDPAAESKGYEVPSTSLRTGLRLMKGAGGDPAKELLPAP